MPQGSGSGFVWDKSGHIVTNFHVIRGASDLRFVKMTCCCRPLRAEFESYFTILIDFFWVHEDLYRSVNCSRLLELEMDGVMQIDVG